MTDDSLNLHAGLCGTCVHALVRPTRRATVYLRCVLAATDRRYPKYPQLPKQNCDGHESEVTVRPAAAEHGRCLCAGETGVRAGDQPK